MFGCTFVGDGLAIGNIQNVTGQGGTFVDGSTYDYLYNQGPDSYVDYISANGGTIFFKSQDNLGRAVSYDGPTNNYRAIHSAFIFGALRDGSSSRDELMATYMDYLLSAPGVTEASYSYVEHLMLGPNPFTHATHLSFTLSNPSRVKIHIYNTVGQLIRELVKGDLVQGPHQFIWEGNDEYGMTVSSGTYIVRIEIDKEVFNRAIVLMK